MSSELIRRLKSLNITSPTTDSQIKHFNIKRYGRNLVLISLNTDNLEQATAFGLAHLVAVVEYNEKSKDALAELVNRLAQGEYLKQSAHQMADFIATNLPKCFEKLFDLLFIAAMEHYGAEESARRGVIYKPSNSLHNSIAELEKEIRRLTKAHKTGPPREWTNNELREATENAAAEVRTKYSRKPTYEETAKIINREHPNKTPFTSETLRKRLKQHGIVWKDIEVIKTE